MPALPWIGALVILGGLIVAEITTQLAPDLSFYWLISRIWELAAGAAVGCLLFFRTRPAPAYWHKAMPVLGLLLIVIPIWSMTQYFHHPGLGTVACVLGTCLVLGFADPEEPVTRLLSNRICVGVGLISYSLYLWHYPIFAFGRLTTSDPSIPQKLLWLALATGLSILSYRLVENPFRRRVGLRGLFISFTTASAVIIIFCLSMLVHDGLRSRFPDLIALYGQNEFDNPRLQDISWSVLSDLAARQGFGRSDASEPSIYEAEVNWFADTGARTRVLVVGNSHGKDLFNALYLSQDNFPDHAFARFGMSPRLPQEQIETLFRSPNLRNADKVLISFKYIRSTLRSLPNFLKVLQSSGKDIRLVLNTVEFENRDHLPVFDWYLQTHRTQAVTEIETLAFTMRDTERVERTNSELRHIAAQLGIPVLDRAPFICDEDNARCDMVTPEGYKAFYDYGHFTVEGARHFGRKIAQTGWLEN